MTMVAGRLPYKSSSVSRPIAKPRASGITTTTRCAHPAPPPGQLRARGSSTRHAKGPPSGRGPASIDVATPFFSFSDSIGTNFGASELLFSLRVYEPFRRWGP